MSTNTRSSQIHDQLAHLCSTFELIDLPDGALTLATPFVFPDGDHYPIIFRQREGRWYITDDGLSLSHWDYEPFAVTDARRAQVDRAVRNIGGRLTTNGAVEVALPETFDMYDVAPFIAVIAAIAGAPAMEPAERADERFATKGKAAIDLAVSPGVQRTAQWAPALDAGRLYSADLWVATNRPKTNGLATFFVSTTGRAEKACTSLLRWRDWSVNTDSVIVVREDSDVTRASKARLSDIAGPANVITDTDDFTRTIEVLSDRGVHLVAA